MTESQKYILNCLDAVGRRKTNCILIPPSQYSDKQLPFTEFETFESQLAILTHYALLKDEPSLVKKYANEAKKLWTGLTLDKQSDIPSIPNLVPESSPLTSYLSKDIFSVPFQTPKNSEFTFIDLFAGVGGFRIALQSIGGKCVFSSEWDTNAQKTYFANYGEMPFGDITKDSIKKFIPDNFDVLCAGFPCQPFSISGKQKGFEDTRGTLFFDICEIIEKKQPKVVFLENVKHLLHHDNGNTLETILSKLNGLGYSVSWKILNGSDFGIPQNRERIIIVGSKNKEFDFSQLKKQPKRPLIEFMDKDGDFEFLKPDEYTLINDPKKQPESGLIFAGYRNKSIRKAGVRPGTEHLSRVHKQPNRIYSVNGIHPTLPSQESSGRFFILLNDNTVRKLTIQECWRIMGFPDEFIKISSMGHQYRQLGNSVCVKMIQEIGKEIKKQLL